ncbi:hypothetical protein [Rathayibacter rathayi]|uniref:hypothetical protein n=1 Tax=Rathayibacter rathayi TaxID=33887 RepID=UPI000CE85D4A|nr:hypothetical protein [Rathayibacter rathayi]PPF21812.1 hypothetical protein C5C34_12530 [Rathayibacter rathayi]PPG66294.1 hypothetical protein C5C02_11775 [Rathayibacter rathayi]PPG76865.1 hypothetical protein C5C23_06725 [Rathayibacter rathayi]PPI75833.1 hypothetical protein C5E03_12810 [Rathayibacter rathayi]
MQAADDERRDLERILSARPRDDGANQDERSAALRRLGELDAEDAPPAATRPAAPRSTPVVETREQQSGAPNRAEVLLQPATPQQPTAPNRPLAPEPPAGSTEQAPAPRALLRTWPY